MIIDLETKEVVFGPSTVAQEIAQNIRNIVNTWYFEVPFFRDFGLQPDYLDSPPDYAQMQMRADLIEKINRDEPRAKVENISFSGDALNGKLKPTVRISYNG